eukprot:gnl/TRDRNA2_/TRDRNA2_169577_c1_seq2.p1 gnl/TRDRNA2_/TRDRNA2_169577_c1~~gnl/TRDRNA2_/TRDRNA2_169577_c1_seq2.p1  ORF type:complete len:153 (+),score=29.47 gnl/TRDRNA2_/TRDRNA2_169577_c1_seq2:11-469(+)
MVQNTHPTGLLLRVKDADETVIQAAVQALAEVAERGEKGVSEVVLKCLGHDSAAVRHAAVQALAAVVDKGDEHAINAVAMRLDSKSEAIRMIAVEALGQVASMGDENAKAIITQRAMGYRGDARLHTCLDALAQVADAKTVSTMRTLLTTQR